MRRREIACLLAGQAVFALMPQRARSAGKTPRIVFVVPVGRYLNAEQGDGYRALVEAFLQGLRDLGYVDGSTMKFEFHSAEGRSEKIDEIASRILESPPDVVLAGGGGANEVAHAFKRLTRTVPIVMANSSDPVMQGLVQNLARPGGNITGFTGNTGPDFEVKRLQLLREVVPDATRLAYLGLKLDWGSPAAIGVRDAAEKLGITMMHAEHTPLDYNGAFAFMIREQLHGLFVARNPWNFFNRQSITRFAADQRIAAVYPTREFADVAGLMSYGPSLSDLYRRAASYVDKILKGGKPADLPVEQPIKFEFVINSKAAQAIGIAVSASLLARADEVLE